MIVSLFVQPATAPYCSHFAWMDASGLVRPRRLRYPYFSCDGFRHTVGASSGDSSRMPHPSYKYWPIVPASQYDAPLELTPRPATTVLRRPDTRPLAASWRDAQKFTLPAPAPRRPPLFT